MDLSNAELSDATYRGSKITHMPISLTGLRWPVLLIADYLIIGCQEHTIQTWREFSDNDISRMAPDALEFWKLNKDRILAFCEH